MFARIHGLFDGSGWFIAGAAGLLLVALLITLAELQAPEALLWTGQPVAGSERSGIGYYRWDGQQYTVDIPGGTASAASKTFYVDPGNPSTAVPDSTGTRVSVSLAVGVPAVAGLALLALGGTRNRRWRRRNEKRGETGWWLDKVPPRDR